MHPGPGNEFAVIRFTAPGNSVYHLAGSFFGHDLAPTTTDVHILANGTSVFDGAVNGFGPGSGPAFNLSIPLGAGGSIEFAVGFGANHDFHSDSTGLSVQITSDVTVLSMRVSQVELCWATATNNWYHLLGQFAQRVPVAADDAFRRVHLFCKLLAAIRRGGQMQAALRRVR